MVDEKGEPFFVGNDIAKALGYKNSRDALNRHVDDEDKGVAKRDTLGGHQQMVIINESGLYSLILSSLFFFSSATPLRTPRAASCSARTAKLARCSTHAATWLS